MSLGVFSQGTSGEFEEQRGYRKTPGRTVTWRLKVLWKNCYHGKSWDVGLNVSDFIIRFELSQWSVEKWLICQRPRRPLVDLRFYPVDQRSRWVLWYFCTSFVNHVSQVRCFFVLWGNTCKTTKPTWKICLLERLFERTWAYYGNWGPPKPCNSGIIIIIIFLSDYSILIVRPFWDTFILHMSIFLLNVACIDEEWLWYCHNTVDGWNLAPPGMYETLPVVPGQAGGGSFQSIKKT